MELELVYDTEDAIPEAFRQLYTEKDGKWTFSAIRGLATNSHTPALESANKKLRDEVKALKADVAKFKGIDAATIHEDLAELEELRATGGGQVDDKKVDEIVEARVKRRVTGLEREVTALKEQLGEATTERDGLKAEAKRGKVTEAARAAAAKLKVQPEAIDDVMVYAERLFDIDDAGTITTRDGVGVTPGLTVEQWLTDRQKDRPHWWPRTTGGGAKDSTGRSLAENPWTKANWSLSAQGAYVRAHGSEKAAAAAKAAGSSVGATAPPAE